MILYHGGTEIISRPEIRHPNRTLDFGGGFYLTTSLRQAQDWVRRHLDDKIEMGYVNSYSFLEDEAAAVLDIRRFDAATEEWLDFVMSNRKIDGFCHAHDIVIGPVADDRVYTAFALFEGGIIDKPTLIKELKTYRLVDQYLFHTEASLDFLSFMSADSVGRCDRQVLS